MFSCLRFILLAIVAVQLGQATICEQPTLVNGFTRLLRNDSEELVVTFHCNAPYVLVGSDGNICFKEEGKWSEEAKPVCAKPGCTKPTVKNGVVSSENDHTVAVKCDRGLALAGYQRNYCNGTHWNPPLATCIDKFSCDFETDMCGWISIGNSFTRFSSDHTAMQTNSGHFLLPRGFDGSYAAYLLSPLYPAEKSKHACFQFWYLPYVIPKSFHVLEVFVEYGQDVQVFHTINIYRRDRSVRNVWQKGSVRVPEVSEDFRLRIRTTDGYRDTAGFAIDDVELIKC